jgi:hypothetical protein
VVGDFNGDGHLDIAVCNSGFPDYKATVSILLGNGDGTLQPAQTFAAGTGLSALVAADFNGDGKLDLAVANTGIDRDYKGTVSLLLGNGDGTFGPAQSYVISSQSGLMLSLAVGDFNGDGTPDLVAVDAGNYPNYEGTGSVLLGNGDGTFQPALTFSAGSRPLAVAVGDFNGDGNQDLVTAAQLAEREVRVYLGNGDGTFQAGQTFAEDGAPVAVAVGDFNGDGLADLALVDAEFPNFLDRGNTVTVLSGKDDGSFVSPHHFLVDPQHFVVGGNPASLAVGDFNGDGHLDLAVADYVNPGAVTILLNAGPGGGNSSRPPE